MQRSGTEAISKPKREITNITNTQNTYVCIITAACVIYTWALDFVL